MKLPGLQFGFGRQLPLILQGEASECGLACLAMMAGYHGYHTDLLTLRQRFVLGMRGATLKGLIEISSALHLSSRPLRVELEQLQQLPTPCILHWDLNHFVVLKKVVRGAGGAASAIVIHDPARGVLTVPMTEASISFTGVVLELTPAAGFKPAHDKQRIRVRDMLGSVSGWRRVLGQVLILAVVLEAFALGAPFFMQLVVDGAILSGDRDLLAMLALGFGMLMLVQTGLGMFRSWFVVYLGNHLNLQWMANVFTHLVRLPMDFFGKRHLGDVVSRFNSVQAIQRTLSSTFVEALIDGLLAVATLCMLFVYSAGLALVVLASLALYGLARWAFYHPFRRASEEQLNLQAREQTLFLESVRGIQAIKLFNHEDERRARWLNALAAAMNRNIATQQMSIGFNTAHTLMAGVENIVIVYLGARLVMDNSFSVGMLYAFLSYKTTFTTRMYALIDRGLELRMLSLQGERLADIVLHQQEDETAQASHGELSNTTIELRDVWFRYSDADPWILRGVNLTIAEGESVALAGPSGCGKTTLLKLMLGLLRPNEGEILVGGLSLSRLAPRQYRSLIGAVMQDDQLLTGSISENVTFFDTQPDVERMQRCIAMAGMGVEVAMMPMGVQTLIGDMGTSLSGGQKQRLLLARALYKQPRILFLDEATSHLDPAREQEINRAVNALSVTRVQVAHRSETLRSVARVVELDKGVVLRDLRQAEPDLHAQA